MALEPKISDLSSEDHDEASERQEDRRGRWRRSRRRVKEKAARKRAQPTASTTEAEAEEAQKFKKAKPSICQAAEELICPILQGLPIDPVVAADVSQGIYLHPAVFIWGTFFRIDLTHVLLVFLCHLFCRP